MPLVYDVTVVVVTCLLLALCPVMADHLPSCSTQQFAPCPCDSSSDVARQPYCYPPDVDPPVLPLLVTSLNLTLMTSRQTNQDTGRPRTCQFLRMILVLSQENAKEMLIRIESSTPNDASQSYLPLCRRVPVDPSPPSAGVQTNTMSILLPLAPSSKSLRMRLVTIARNNDNNNNNDNNILAGVDYLVAFSLPTKYSWINPVVALKILKGHLQVSLSPPSSNFRPFITYTMTLARCVPKVDQLHEGADLRLSLWNHSAVNDWVDDGRCWTDLKEINLSISKQKATFIQASVDLPAGMYQLWVDAILLHPTTGRKRHQTLRTPSFAVEKGTKSNDVLPSDWLHPLQSDEQRPQAGAGIPRDTETRDGAAWSDRDQGWQVDGIWVFPLVISVCVIFVSAITVAIVIFWLKKRNGYGKRKIVHKSESGCAAFLGRSIWSHDKEPESKSGHYDDVKSLSTSGKSTPENRDFCSKSELEIERRIQKLSEDANPFATITKAPFRRRLADTSNVCNISRMLESWREAESLLDASRCQAPFIVTQQQATGSPYHQDCQNDHKQLSSGYYSEQNPNIRCNETKKPNLAQLENSSLTSSILEDKLYKLNEECPETDSLFSELQELRHLRHECVSLTDAISC